MNNPRHNKSNLPVPMTKKALWLVLIFIFGLGAGLLLYKIGFSAPENNGVSLPPDRKQDAKNKLINPLLECEFAENSFVELRPFGEDIKNFVNQINYQNNQADFIAVYFRDLNNGPWFGINEKTDFYPASLLKVPIMITYFKEAENNPSILKKTYTLEDNGKIPKAEQTILPLETIQIGKSYTVEDLIYRMIVYSDNLAQHLLVEKIDLPTLAEVFSDFGLTLPDQSHPQTQISVRDYSRFFRVLFNASYLNKEYSQKSLELLSQSKFNDGLVAGVPKDIIVAHKFGERQLSGQPEKQLHDCGIIYYPNHPYLLCVMSRGNNINDLAKVIRDISRYTYNKFDSEFRGK